MAGLTAEGLVIKRYSKILEDKRNKAVSLFLDLVGPNDVVDTSDSTTLGRLIALSVPGEADLWEAIQEVYDAFNPNAATGVSLDNLVALGGLNRLPASSSTAALLLSGDRGTLIPMGSVVSSPATGERFTLTQPVGLTPDNASGAEVVVGPVTDNTTYSLTYVQSNASQTVSVDSGVGATQDSILAALNAIIISSHPTLTSSVDGGVLVVNRVDPFQRVTFSVSNSLSITGVVKIGEGIAETAGPIRQEVGTLTSIITPVLGWRSVTNPTPATVGRNRETDEELRDRFRDSKFQRSVNTLDAIYSALSSVPGVVELKLYENDTSEVDENGLPPKSFLPVIVGGSSVDIGNAIWRTKPIGILSAGNTTVNVEDIQGFSHTVAFERPSPVVVYIDITLTAEDTFPPNGEELIRQELIEYFEERFRIGDDVIYSRLFTPINRIQGHQVDDMVIGIDPQDLGYPNIPVSFNEIASISDVNISITVN